MPSLGTPLRRWDSTPFLRRRLHRFAEDFTSSSRIPALRRRLHLLVGNSIPSPRVVLEHNEIDTKNLYCIGARLIASRYPVVLLKHDEI